MMATETTKKKSKKRTYPYKKAHREMVDMMLSGETVDMLIEMALSLDESKIKASEKMQNFVLEKVVERVIEPANQRLDPSMQQTSLPLYSTDGKYRFSVNQQINQNFDGRSHQAISLIGEFIEEHKHTDTETNVAWIIEMFESMFFGSSRNKSLRHTPELKRFMSMDDDDLPDDRLITARDLLNDAYFTKRSQWYYRIKVWDEKKKDYVKHEEYLNAGD